ncbi:PcfJ domain-containing protein [Listeria monocytogenes]
MGHRCEYYSHLTLHGDEIVNEVTAVYMPKNKKSKSALVYEEHEDGTNYCRYLYHSSMCGYVVVFPNEPLNYYYGYAKQEVEDLTECRRLGLTINWTTKDADLKYIAKARPELKYLINKFDGTATQFIDLVNKYKKNNSIESLVELGLNNIALDKRLEKLSKKKKLEIINFIKINKVGAGANLTEILFCIKYKVELKDIPKYAENHYNYKLTNYFIKNSINKYVYDDYIKMCKELNKNLKDEYWLYPSNFNERHNQVMDQLNRVREARRIAREKELERALIEKQKKILDVANTLKKNNKKINGYDIYIPSTIKDISNQADVLHQCLITCDYPSKVAKKQSVLVFIKKENKPIATAEISYQKKLLQFYGDERDRNNCKPNEEVTDVFNQWLSAANIFKRETNAVA